MHLVFDIFQGIGVSAAVGIRPFFPTVAVGALAAGNVEIHFGHTSYSFLQGVPFLLAFAAAGIALALVERRLEDDASERGPLSLTVGGIGLVAAALLFAGSLARGHYTAWPGWFGGIICAGLAIAAIWPLLARVRSRLEGDAADVVPLYAEVGAVLLAGLSVVAPPVGPIALALLVWLLVARRRRHDEKYAGLRILR